MVIVDGNDDDDDELFFFFFFSFSLHVAVLPASVVNRICIVVFTKKFVSFISRSPIFSLYISFSSFFLLFLFPSSALLELLYIKALSSLVARSALYCYISAPKSHDILSRSVSFSFNR